MPRFAAITRRLARRVQEDERGMTLIELMVGISMGLVVTFAAFTAMDAATKMQTRTEMRIDTVNRGRNAVSEITAAIRAQQCYNGQRPMLWASDAGMEFYSSIAPRFATTFQPVEIHRIKWVANPSAPKDIQNGSKPTGDIHEYVWRANTAGVLPSTSTQPTSSVVLAEDVEQAPDRRNSAVLAPFFRYYKYSAATGSGRIDYTDPVDMTTMQNGVLSSAPGDLNGIVLVEISFRSSQRKTNTGKGAAMNFYNTVSVRIADPTNPGGSPQCL